MTGNSWENTTKENSQLLTTSGKRLQQHSPLVNISPPDISIGGAEREIYIEARSNIKLFRGEGLLPRRRFGAAVIDRH